MANAFQYTTTGNGSTADFTPGFTMDADLNILDVTITVSGVKVSNFTKFSTTVIRFSAPLPSGTIYIERFKTYGQKAQS